MQRDLLQLHALNSEYLFRGLIKLFNADLVCDVGSFDGAHALLFARSGAHVVALEANPINAEALSVDSNVAEAGIETLHLAAWNSNQDIAFNVLDTAPGDLHNWAKMSSIRTRADSKVDSKRVMIKAVRLDSLVSARTIPAPSSVGLWIDVEGVGYEVLEGMSGIRNIVSVIFLI